METFAASPTGRLLPALLGALLVASITATAGTVPYAESFESYTNEHPITLETYWSALDSADALVSTSADVVNAETNYPTGGKSFPLNTTHAKVLKLTGEVTNTVTGTAGSIVFLDFMALPSHRSTVPAATASDQCGLYFDTNGDAVIWHHNTTGPTNEWLTLTNSPTVSSSEWHRVRISLDYVNDMFQVEIDEGDPIQDGNGYAFGGGSQPGSWFLMVQSNGALGSLTIDGTKPHYMDDLVVSNRSVTYSATTFNEGTNNNGSINNSSPMIITKNNDTFTGSNGEDFVGSGKLTVGSVPAGLTVVAERTSDTTLSVTLTGSATSHGDADDISNLSFTFADGACTLGNAIDVTGYTRSDLVVDFFDTPEITYVATSFTESGANDGSIAAGTTLSVGGRNFAGANGTNYVNGGNVSVSGVPSGLTVSITKDSASGATIAFSGNASPHTTAENTSSMEFIFNDGAFVEGNASAVIGYSNGTLSVTFYDPFTLTYSKSTFSELSLGLIDNTDPVVITLAGDSFAAGTDFVSEGKTVVANLPASLTVVATRTSGTTLSVTLTGAATAHADANDVSNLQFTFQDSAFVNAQASAVSNYDKSDLAIDFNDGTVAINAVPYEEPFEDYSDGFQIAGTNGWQAALQSAGTVTSKADIVTALSAYSGSGFPLDATNHAQVLCITSEITDEIKSGSGGTVYMDFMAYTAYREIAPAVDTDYQFGFFVDTNGQLNVLHENQTGFIDEWRALSASGPIASNTWIRITVEQDYANHLFQVHIDEGSPINDSAGWTAGGGGQPGSWFYMVNTNNAYMSRLAVNEGGTSYIDDLTVRDTAPDFLSNVPTTVIKFQ
jgi:hypothetical protein